MIKKSTLAAALSSLIEKHPSQIISSREALNPGVSCSDLKSSEKKIGLGLGSHIIELYSEINGVNRKKRWKIDTILVFLQFFPLPLDEAIKLRDTLLEAQAREPELKIWKQDWLPFASDGYGGHLFFELDNRQSARVWLSSNDFSNPMQLSQDFLAYLNFLMLALEEKLFIENSGNYSLDYQKYFARGAREFQGLEYWILMDSAYSQ